MVDAYGQIKWTGPAMPLGTNWFLTMCGIKHVAEPVPHIAAELQILPTREMLAYFNFSFAIIQAASSTFFNAYSITGVALDQYCRGVGANFYRNFHQQTLWRNKYVYGGQAEIFSSIQRWVELMTGYDYHIYNFSRDFNAQQLYPVDHDIYGIYHWLVGRSLVRLCNVFSIDNYIIERPREWGVFTPQPTGNISDDVRPDYLQQDILTITTAYGSDEWIKRWPVALYHSTLVSYCPLLLNAITQSWFRPIPDGVVYAYDTASAYNVPKQIRWLPADPNAYPTPTIIEPISTILPGTLISFDWDTNHYLAPRLVINYPAANVVQNATYQPSITFSQSGMALRMRAGEIAVTWQERPQNQLAPWQVTMPTPHPNVPHVEQIENFYNTSTHIANPIRDEMPLNTCAPSMISTPERRADNIPIGITGIRTVS